MKSRGRRIARWGLIALAMAAVLFGLYLSLFFFPYPFFRHHMEHAGFSVYSDSEFPEDFEIILENARFRVEGMEHYRGGQDLRLFFCFSQRKFETLVRLSGKRFAGQALVISVAGNAFFSIQGIEAVGQRNGGRPVHSRLEGSWSAAIAHEVAHDLIFAEMGYRKARRIPVWKSEGFADFSAHAAAAAADPEYDLRGRVERLLDDGAWHASVSHIDRRHFRWHVLVEFLCSVKGLDFSDLLDEDVTEERARSELMAWFLNPDGDTRQ